MSAAARIVGASLVTGVAAYLLRDRVSMALTVTGAALPLAVAIAAPMCEKAIASVESLRAAYAAAEISGAAEMHDRAGVSRRRLVGIRRILWAIALAGPISLLLFPQGFIGYTVCFLGLLVTVVCILQCDRAEKRADDLLAALQLRQRDETSRKMMLRDTSLSEPPRVAFMAR